MVDVAKIMAKWARYKEKQREQIQDASVDSQGGEEPKGGTKRKGKSQRKSAGVKPKAPSKKRGQPKTRKLSSKDG